MLQVSRATSSLSICREKLLYSILRHSVPWNGLGENADYRRNVTRRQLHYMRVLHYENITKPKLWESNCYYSPTARGGQFTRGFHASVVAYDKDQKSKVEKTVEALKDSMKAAKQELSSATATDKGTVTPAVVESKIPVPVAQPPVKKSLGQWLMAELRHYYHGFRLLFIDIKVSAKLAWAVLNGESLSRREHKLLVRTVSDIFRLVPFSVFIIVPFMEFLLPFFIKFFPGMLPSTFQSKDDRDAKMKTSLKVKLEMAKFLQDTLDEMALQSKGDKRSQAAKDFSLFFEKIRASGEQASNEDILRFSKLFEDEITLDSLSRAQLVAICKLLELQAFGTTAFMRFQLRMRLRSLIADDKTIQKEGINNLNTWELQQACKARGMRAVGVSEARMQKQLQQWLELSLDEKIPPSLLLLSRVLYLPEHLPAPDQLKATISTLPDAVATQAKAKLGEMEGKVDNKTKIDIIRDEEKRIKEEKEELAKIELEKKQKEALMTASEKIGDLKELLVDKANALRDSATEVGDKVEELSSKDLDVIEDAIANIAAEKKKLLLEKEELEDLKEELEEYKEDIEELQDVKALSGVPDKQLHPSKGAVRLYNRVSKMIKKMDTTIENLERKAQDGPVAPVDVAPGSEAPEEDEVNINDLLRALNKLKAQPDATRMQKIADMLEKLDMDHDGNVKVDDILEVIEMIGNEDVKLNSKQVTELVQLLEKEDNLEIKEKIEKSIEREVQQQELAKAGKGVAEDKKTEQGRQQ